MNLKRKVLVGLVASSIMAPGAFSVAAERPAQSTKAPAARTARAPRATKAVANEQVKAIQEALNKQGASLKVDGVLGAKTRAALKKFQKDSGLKVTGKADQATLEKLGVAAAAPAKAAAPKPATPSK